MNNLFLLFYFFVFEIFFRNKLSNLFKKSKKIKPCDVGASFCFSTFALICNSIFLVLELFFFFLTNNKPTNTVIPIKQKLIGIIVASKIVVSPLFELRLRLDKGVDKGGDEGVGEGIGEGVDEGVGKGVDEGVGKRVGGGVGTVQLHLETLLQSVMVLLSKSLQLKKN